MVVRYYTISHASQEIFLIPNRPLIPTTIMSTLFFSAYSTIFFTTGEVLKNTSLITFRPFNLVLFLYLSYMRLCFCIATIMTSFRAGAICELLGLRDNGIECQKI